MKTHKPQHGGSGRGQGRKPLDTSSPTVTVTLKMTDNQRGKLARLGGAPWVRTKIDKAREPKDES